MSKPESSAINAKTMAKTLATAGIELTEGQIEQLWQFHRFLRDRDRTLNLTRIHAFGAMVRKHYIDSLIIIKILKDNSIPFPARLLDFGSGGGLPGIPLAIALPEQQFILNDSRKVRTDFLEEAAHQLGLENVTVLQRSLRSGDQIEAQAIISRAVEAMPATIQRFWGSLPDGGLVIFMKGPNCDDEIDDVQKLEHVDCRLLLNHSYCLPDSTDNRRLVVWQFHYSSSFKQFQTVSRRPLLIESDQNPRYRLLKKLYEGRQIRRENRALICGAKIVREVLRRHRSQVEAALYPDDRDYVTTVDEQRQLLPELYNNLQQDCQDDLPPVWLFEKSLFRQLDQLKTGAPLLLVKTEPLPQWDPSLSEPGITVLLPLGDPENLGAAIRSAAAFGVRKIVLLKEAASPYHPRAIRASAGHCFDVKLESGPALAELSALEQPILTLAQPGKSLAEIERREEIRLLVGSEGGELPEGDNFQRISIPIEPGVDSLNAATALAIALYELKR